MVKFIYQNPTRLIFGENQIEQLADQVKPFGNKVLLVYGGGSIKKTGLYDEVMHHLADFTVFELGGVEPNPRVTTAEKGAQLIREHDIDFVLAVGGGSVIDCTKLIVAAAHYNGPAWDIVMNKHIPEKATPFGTILTLAATASEMNAGSVITNEATKQKFGWGSPLVYPTFSILDPTYTYTLPKNQTINGIVDMMSHLVEEYFNEAENTVIMDGMIESTLRAIIEAAPVVLETPTDYHARETLMMAGTIALNGSLRWGYAGDWSSHAIEHAVSAYYDIAHAEGLAIVMPNWMLYVMPKHVDRFAQFARHVFHIHEGTEQEIAEKGIRALQDFWQSIGAPTRLADRQIDAIHIPDMAQHCVERGSFGNLEKLGYDDAVAILTNSL